MNEQKNTYTQALRQALQMMEYGDLEPTSALKQAASDMGIDYGDEMAEFVEWAYGQLGL